MTMRNAAALLILSLLTQGASISAADEAYPSRQVTLVHGFAAGGNADAMSRIMADQLSKEMGQPFVVDAKPGAGGENSFSLPPQGGGGGVHGEPLGGGDPR